MKPEIYLGDLYGSEGNAFVILGKARKLAMKHKLNWKKIREEAISGDYDHLLETIEKYFEVL